MLKYKCPECGTPLGYDGLCWQCKARHHRQEVENWTADDVLEKIKIVINKLNSYKEDDDKNFYSSDECIIFYDLLSKGVDISSITKAAVENSIYWPSSLYYKADDKVTDVLIKKIMETSSSREGADLLSCLAMSDNQKAQQALVQLKNEPKHWQKFLYVGPDVYAECGGWTFNEKNEYIRLIYDKCYAFEKSDKKEESGAYIGRKKGEKCKQCGCDLIDMLVIDGRDERFAFLGIDGIITASCCPNCVGMSEDISCKFSLDGKSEILEYEGIDENYIPEENINKIINNNLSLTKTDKPLFYGTFSEDAHTIGGFGNWVQDWEYRECPECGKKMKYLAQIHWDALEIFEGTLYFEICPDCKIITMLHQQT